ncbi:MAG: PQQ-binding-like beta-propeller repeat protein [Planctomycetota bacterium]|nr:PQQ-binding-like beta-propeller repeat protein [Planctomycetota bacterium]
MRILLVGGLVCLISQTVWGARNWPQLHGPSANSHAESTQLPLTWSETQNVKWKTAIHGRGWSSPVVWENQIWVTTASADGKRMSVLCVDRESGRTLHDRLLYENEKPRFGNDFNSYASPTPVIEAGRVYVHFGSYGTACLDTATCRTLWSRRDLPCDHWRRPGSSPILFQNLLIVHYDGFDHQYVVALNKTTGKTIWKVDRDIDYGSDNGDVMKAYGTPIVIEVNGELQLISPAAKATLAYNPNTGTALWKLRYPQHSVAIRPMFRGGLLYLNTGFSPAQLLAIRPDGRGDITGTHVAWSVRRRVPSMPSQLLVGDAIYMVHDDGVATRLDAKTGKVQWQERLEGKYTASLLYAPGRIYCFDRDGRGVVLKAGETFERLAVNQLDEGMMSSPAVTDKAILLRTKKHLYCIEQ